MDWFFLLLRAIAFGVWSSIGMHYYSMQGRTPSLRVILYLLGGPLCGPLGQKALNGLCWLVLVIGWGGKAVSCRDIYDTGRR